MHAATMEPGLDGLMQTLKGLGRTRLAILGALGLGIVLTVAVLAQVISRPSMGVLYADLSPGDAASMVTAIEQMGIPVEVGADGSTIRVPHEKIPRLRLALAEQGLPDSGTMGYEVFDEQGTLGLTSFMQSVNRVRALEGELSRTIQTLDQVKAARVHLVLGERDAFTRERPEPSASVVIRMRSGKSMAQETAGTIRHLVASAVPSLDPGKVTVLDARGTVLLAEGTDASVGGGSVHGLKAEQEARIVAAVERMLFPRLGPGNARVQATVELTTEREIIREESFDPSRIALRSTQLVEETEQSRERAGNDAATIEQNIPETDIPIGPEDTNRSDLERSEEVTNYEVSSVRRERYREAGELKRQSIAVMVNGVHETAGDGTRSYRPRSAEELERIANLVKAAVGFDARRGDQVIIENLEFYDLDEELTPLEAPSITAVLSQNVMTLIQWLMLLVISVLVLQFGIRPMVARLLPAPAAPSTAEPPAEAPKTDDTAPPALAAGEAGDLPQLEAPKNTPMDVALDQMLELRAVKGQVRATSVRKLGQIVDDHPDEVITILRNWIHEEAR